MKILPVIILLFLLIGCHHGSVRGFVSSKGGNQPDFALLKTELQEIFDIDQKVRNINWDSLHSDPAKQNAYALKMEKIDSANQSRLIPILDKYGWLPKSKIGEKAANAIYLVIQHSNLETIAKYLPQMEKLAHEGEASATQPACSCHLFVSRHLCT